MSPYRTAPTIPHPPRRVRSALAFRSATMRLGTDRFELGFLDSGPLFAAIMVGLCVPSLETFLATGAVVLVLALVSRMSLVVTRDTSWAQRTVLGIRWRKIMLGRRPEIRHDGWSWSEIALVPTEPALLSRLGDEGRVVLADWSAGDGRSDDEAHLLMSLAVDQLARLHGVR